MLSVTPSLILIITFSLFFQIRNFLNVLFNKTLLIYILYLYIIYFELTIDPYLLISQYEPIQFNIPLLNGFYFIHPVLLLLCYSYFILIFLYQITQIKMIHFIHFYSFFYYKNIKIYLKNLLLTMVLTLFLGAYWSFQEINWNGWWDWDLVELSCLYNILFLLIYIHKPFYTRTLFILPLIIICVNFYSIRYGLYGGLHSFFKIELVEKTIYFLCLNTIIFLFILKYYYIRIKYTRHTNLLMHNLYYKRFLKNLFNLTIYIYLFICWKKHNIFSGLNLINNNLLILFFYIFLYIIINLIY